MPNIDKSSQIGNPQGQTFDDFSSAAGFGTPITGFNIRSGNIVDNIQAVYGNNASQAHGGSGGVAGTVRLDPGDYFTEISGYTGNWFGPVFILQLAFKTRYGKIHYTPANAVFGNMEYASNKVAFSIKAPQGMQIRAIYGTTFATNNGQLTVLSSLGAYFHIAPAEPGQDSNLAQALSVYCHNVFGNAGDPHCALIVCRQTVDQGAIAYETTYYGYSSQKNTNPTAGTNFCIGSVTKSFTGTLLAARILENGPKGPYSVGADVSTFLPLGNNIGPKKLILKTTLGQLATHSACFVPNFSGANHGLYNGKPQSTQEEMNPSPDQINQWLNNKDNWIQDCTSGTDANYSNWGFITLAFALSRPAQPSGLYNYDPVLKTYVNDLFMLTNTSTQTDTTCDQGYTVQTKAGKLNLVAAPKDSAHGIRSSVTDMATYLGSYLAGLYQAANESNPGQLAQTVRLAVQKPYTSVSNALGWGVGTLKGTTYQLISKNGSTGAQGFSSWIGLLPNTGGGACQQAGVVVLVNCAAPQEIAAVPQTWRDGAMGPKPDDLGRRVLRYLTDPSAQMSGFTLDALPDENDDDA